MAKKSKPKRTALRTRSKAERAAIDQRAAEAKRPPRAKKSMQRIPISAGKLIAQSYGYDQVVIVARKTGPGGSEHVTTYGISKVHCEVAAQIGEFFKHKLMGWAQREATKSAPATTASPPAAANARATPLDAASDRNGRPWARLSELKEGQTIELDGGFTCHRAGQVTLHSDPGGLYFECKDGHHYVIGQADDGEHCVGIYPVAAPAASVTEQPSEPKAA